MYTKYIIPICNIQKSKVYNKIIHACSIKDCQDKLMHHFEQYSTADNYNNFIEDLDKKDILIGDITDIEIL